MALKNTYVADTSTRKATTASQNAERFDPLDEAQLGVGRLGAGREAQLGVDAGLARGQLNAEREAQLGVDAGQTRINQLNAEREAQLGIGAGQTRIDQFNAEREAQLGIGAGASESAVSSLQAIIDQLNAAPKAGAGGAGGAGGAAAPTAEVPWPSAAGAPGADATGGGQAAPNATSSLLSNIQSGLPPPNIDRAEKYDKTGLVSVLDQQVEAARMQAEAAYNRAMDEQSTALQRAMEDANMQYQTQRDQIAANEMSNLDNSALYAEARGDKGGIGQAQYSNIQNAAAQNRVSVNQAQTKLTSDTSRQIAELRAQGEYDKADALLDLTQSYLSELQSIEQYAASYNLNVDQINTAISEWEAEYKANTAQYLTSTELSMAQLTGQFADGKTIREVKDKANQGVADLAMALLQNGMKPADLTDVQKQALTDVYGMDGDQASAYYTLSQPKPRASDSGSPRNVHSDAYYELVPLLIRSQAISEDPSERYKLLYTTEAQNKGLTNEEILELSKFIPWAG